MRKTDVLFPVLAKRVYIVYNKRKVSTYLRRRKNGENKMKKKYIKKFFWICLVFAFLGAVLLAGVFGINAYVKKTTAASILAPEDITGEYDCIMVLGCGVDENGTPSAMLADRLQVGISLQKDGKATKILMSGDHGRVHYDEVNAMRKVALQNDIPAEDVFMDHAGFSTYESMYRAKEIFGVQKMIIVTNQYHLYRALYIAEKLGIKAVGVSGDLRTYFGQTGRDAREVLARCKDFVKCITKPEPTFLGEAIPVSGDGRKSWDEGAASFS